MVFGQIKTIIEENFVNSYTNKEVFSENVKGFKKNFLSNKDLTKLYLLYDELSTPKGLTKEQAKDFIEEGIGQIKELLSNVEIPKVDIDVTSKYKDIDAVTNNKNLSIGEILEHKTNIMNLLMEKPKIYETNVFWPISSVVKMANKSISEYIESLDESTRNDLFFLLTEEDSKLEKDFELKKTEVLDKLESLIKEEKEDKNIETINATIEKVKNEGYNKINYYKLKELMKNL